MTIPRFQPLPAARMSRHRVLPFLALLLSLSLVLAGCSSEGSAANNSDESAATPATQEDAILAFYQCLRDNGLDVPDPSGNGGIQIQGLDRDDPDQMAIVEGCASEHELGGPGGGGAVMRGGGSGGGQLADPEALIDFAECMRENGIDMPDPDADGSLTMPDGMDRSSPELQTAVEACREHLAGGGMRITR